MSTPDSTTVAGQAGGSMHLSGISNPGRAYVLTGASGISALGTTPTAGGEIDGVSCEFSGGRMFGIPATKGLPFQAEAGGADDDGSDISTNKASPDQRAKISDADDLQVDGNGRFETASGGTVVARALEGASFGSFFWCVFV